MRYSEPSRPAMKDSTRARAAAWFIALSLAITGCSTFSSGDALSTVDTYFEEYNAGDHEAVTSLLTADAKVDFFGPMPLTEFAMITAFFTGMGTILTAPDCTATDEVSEESATVYCEFETIDGRTQVVDAPPVPSAFTAVITPKGIGQLVFEYGNPDFLHVGRPLASWIAQHHPEEVEATEVGEWSTVEEARESGEATARLAAEWATFLEENDCVYTELFCREK